MASRSFQNVTKRTIYQLRQSVEDAFVAMERKNPTSYPTLYACDDVLPQQGGDITLKGAKLLAGGTCASLLLADGAVTFRVKALVPGTGGNAYSVVVQTGAGALSAVLSSTTLTITLSVGLGDTAADIVAAIVAAASCDGILGAEVVAGGAFNTATSGTLAGGSGAGTYAVYINGQSCPPANGDAVSWEDATIVVTVPALTSRVAGDTVNCYVVADSVVSNTITIPVAVLKTSSSAITGYTAATDTAGANVYAETEDAGGTATAARTGGLLSVKCGDGSAGATTVAGGAGGAVTIAGGNGGATTGSGTAGAGGAATVASGTGAANTGAAGGAAGGAGGTLTLTGAAGGATNSTGAHAGGAGGAIAAQAGVGGAATAGTGNGGAGGAVTLVAGAGGATTGGTSGTGGEASATAGAGAASAVAVAGGIGGVAKLQSGAGGANTGGATGQAGGAAGAVNITGGAGGATNSTGAHAGGAGSSVAIAGGAGGNATAGTGNGGAGGAITLTPGTGGTTTGGSAGADGVINLAGETNTYKAGSATGVVVKRFGPSNDEGIKTVVVDKTVSPNAVETAIFTVPASATLRGVLANVQTALTGGGTTVTWSIGTAADPDLYGTAGWPTQADSLAQNSKSSWVGSADTLTGTIALVLTGTATGGAADGNTALTVGSVRVVVIYDLYDALDDA